MRAGWAPLLPDRAETPGPHAALTEKGAEHAPQYGVGERSKKGGEFANRAQD